MFSEEELIECFKRNVDNKGWIYFVGNPESNAKSIVDDIRSHRIENDLDDKATKCVSRHFHLHNPEKCSAANIKDYKALVEVMKKIYKDAYKDGKDE